MLEELPCRMYSVLTGRVFQICASGCVQMNTYGKHIFLHENLPAMADMPLSYCSTLKMLDKPKAKPSPAGVVL